MDSKCDDRWDERGKHGECSEHGWDKQGDAASSGLRGRLPTEEAAGGAVLVPRSARRWAISLAIVAALIGSLGGAYWTSSFHQSALDEAARGPITRPATANPSAASSQPADTTQSSGTPAGQSAAAALPGETPMSGRYPIGPDGKLQRPKDAQKPILPAKPENMRFESKEGMEAFSKHFVELIPYTWLSGDTTKFEEVVLPESKWGKDFLEQIEIHTQNGGWLENAKVTIVSFSGPLPVPEHEYIWRADVKVHFETMHAYDGQRLFTTDAYEDTLMLQAIFTANGWRIQGIGTED